jgi:hypothetical protein
MRYEMHWIAFFIGLFIGANVGIFTAGILFLAKKRRKMQSNIVYEDPHYSGAREAAPAGLQV